MGDNVVDLKKWKENRNNTEPTEDQNKTNEPTESLLQKVIRANEEKEKKLKEERMKKNQTIKHTHNLK